MKLIAGLALAVAATGAVAQGLPQISSEATRPFQIRIRHADPWAVKAMLEGQSLQFPEISTILALSGAPAGSGQALGQATGNAFFTGGKLIVNPGDNSLWFIPDKRS